MMSARNQRLHSNTLINADRASHHLNVKRTKTSITSTHSSPPLAIFIGSNTMPSGWSLPYWIILLSPVSRRKKRWSLNTVTSCQPTRDSVPGEDVSARKRTCNSVLEIMRLYARETGQHSEGACDSMPGSMRQHAG